MDVKNTVEIDLEKYGAEGRIVLRPPTFRKLTELRNARSRYMKMKISRDNANEGTVTGDAEGDLDIMGHMAYVFSAPFKTTVQGFLSFTDLLDEIEVGRGLALWNDIVDAVSEIDNRGSPSPFVSSPEAETVKSD